MCIYVEDVEEIDQIWTQLIAAYDDTRHLVNTKLHSINKLEAIWKLKQPEKVADALAKVVNLMKDLIKLPNNTILKKSCIMEKDFNRCENVWEMEE